MGRLSRGQDEKGMNESLAHKTRSVARKKRCAGYPVLCYPCIIFRLGLPWCGIEGMASYMQVLLNHVTE